jgi:hypothetical protein
VMLKLYSRSPPAGAASHDRRQQNAGASLAFAPSGGVASVRAAVSSVALGPAA